MHLLSSPLSIALSVLPLLDAFLHVSALTGDIACTEKMCVTARVNDDNTTVTYEMEGLDTIGWMAIGFGKHMWNTPMVIMWPNANGSCTLSQRYTELHIEPEVVENPERKAVMTPGFPRFDQMKFPKLSFDIAPNGETDQTIIWAMSNMRPEARIDSTLHRHVRMGLFDLDLTKPISPAQLEEPQLSGNGNQNSSTSRSGSDTIIFAHGLFLSLGFLVLLPFGVLSARFGRSFTSSWFKYHQAFNMYLGVPVITFGWLLGPLAVIDQNAEHLSDPHKVCGVILYAMYISQVFLGRSVHAAQAANAAAGLHHPRKNILHIALGLFIIILSFYQVNSGIHEWHHATGVSPSPTVLSWIKIWTLSLPALYIGGLFLLKRQSRQEKHGQGPSGDLAMGYLPVPATNF